MKRTLTRILIGLVTLLLIAPWLGCANAGGSSGYYQRGSSHSNSFPGTYSYGGYGRYGRYGGYRRY